MKKIVIIFSLLFILFTVSCKKEEYTVTFIGINDEVVSTQKVTSKEKIDYPALPSKEGYVVYTWDKSIEYTDQDISIKALYDRYSYTVIFYNIKGEVISRETVYHGDSATVPSVNMNIDGHTFSGYSTSFDYVSSDLNIYPVYYKNSYVVKFYDAQGEVISTNTVYYKESAPTPDEPSKDGCKFMGWDKSFNEVTSNMDIYPIFEEICYEVSFVDYYGNLLYSECIKHGYSATAPDVPTLNYHSFVKWDQDYSVVTSNMVIKPIYEQDGTFDIRTSDYWLSILSNKYDINKTILNAEEINEFNDLVFSKYSSTKVVDLNQVYKREYGTTVSSMISSYTKMNSYTIYNTITDNALSSSEKNAILDNRNLDNIPTIVDIRFGIVCDFAHLRAYPTNHYAKDYSMDRFQETTFNVGEGLLIYHESKDGLWYFVQGANYNGWIEKKYVGVCSYEAMHEFLNPTTKLVVISDYVKILDKHTRMGQAFPLVSSSDNTYIISFPRVNELGELVLDNVTVGARDFNIGYLDYTYKNLYDQAFKLYGIDYSWGDKETSGRDCSSTMNAIYSCFGFVMPRNTSNQLAIPTYGQKVNGLTVSSMKTYKPGTMIFTSSHVMLYIGESINGEPYLLHNTTSGTGGCILQSFESYGGSRMIAILKMQ